MSGGGECQSSISRTGRPVDPIFIYYIVFFPNNYLKDGKMARDNNSNFYIRNISNIFAGDFN